MNERVRLLVDMHDAGSVNAAAKRSGIPQASLARLADGRTTTPRSDLLERVARAFDVSTDWLITGKGRGPDAESMPETDRFGEAFRWRNLIASLELDPQDNEVWMRLPRALDAAVYFTFLDDGGANESPAFRDAIVKHRGAWCDAVEEWIRQAGVGRVRHHITTPAVRKSAKLRFTDFT